MKKLKFNILIFILFFILPELALYVLGFPLAVVIGVGVSLLLMKLGAAIFLEPLLGWQGSMLVFIFFSFGVPIFLYLFAGGRKRSDVVLRKGIIVGIVFLSFVLQFTSFAVRNHTDLVTYRFYHVPSESMYPHILPGDRIVVDLKAFHKRAPERGDVVVIRKFWQGRPTVYVKRIVGVAQDQVRVEDDLAEINGHLETLGEYVPSKDFEYTDTSVVSHPEKPEHRIGVGYRDPIYKLHQHRNWPFIEKEMTLEEGQFFLLGDHRYRSRDSRHFGLIESEEVLGLVRGVAYSSENYWPQWSRFLQAL